MTLIGTKMVRDNRTAREIFEEVIGNPARRKFGFGQKLAIVTWTCSRLRVSLPRFSGGLDLRGLHGVG